jgi:hypothetical protein
MDPSNEASAPKGHVAVRLDEATIARIDALMPLYALPGREPTRSDALRALLFAGFATEERRAARQLRRRKGRPKATTAPEPSGAPTTSTPPRP